jgi:hypothetical protein
MDSTKHRRAVTDPERLNIRQRGSESPSSQQALIAWFHDQTGTKSMVYDIYAIILMDNFSGLRFAVQLILTQGLQNTTVAWLPNTSSGWQAMDQDILAALKIYYRQQWCYRPVL